MTTVGLIGYGGFGELIAQTLEGKAEVKVFSRTIAKVPKHLRAELADVCACDYLVLSIPLGSYRAVLADVAQHITPNTVVIDVCSVKVKPSEIIKELLPNSPLVATHPLFGPQTIQNGMDNLTFVICDDVSAEQPADVVDDFATTLGLKVVRMTAQEHDKQMAQVHALTFFVARTLLNMDVAAVSLKTPSFEKLLSLIDLERTHSQELFDTIQIGNPFASDVRHAFLREATRIANHLDEEDTV